jgi:hypothetical protein
VVFESERLYFRPIDQGDMNELFNVWGNSETMRFCGGVLTNERIQQIIEHNSTMQFLRL